MKAKEAAIGLPLLVRLFQHISPRRRLQFGALLGLTLVSSMAEVVSLGAVVPFIGILTQPERVFDLPVVSAIARELGFTASQEIVLPMTIAFVLAALIANALRILLLWVSIRLANATGADLSTEVYRRTLHQPYRVHIARSSSEIISGITQKVATATSVLASLVTVITSAAIFSAILITLLAIDPRVASIAIVSFGGSYAFIAWMTHRRLRNNGQAIALQQTNVVKALQEGLGAIRDVLLDGTQKVYSNVYKQSIQQLQRATGENQYITLAPRYVMEAIGMVLIGLFANFMSNQQGGVGAALPTLAALALGAQRLLPILQQLYGNWTVVTGSQASLEDVVSLLEQPLPEDAEQAAPDPLAFNDIICFNKVSFRYVADGPWILQDFNLTIRKGARIGMIGSTGSGKSTALDLLLCLLKPTQGSITVDGVIITDSLRRAWQRTVSHVPQTIYLADATITENIAFGVPLEQIDMERVRRAAIKAHVADFVESQGRSYSTIVGERGVRLSGGQRQRIGIARALYKDASVLIFDEATSALDSKTERSVMEAIEELGPELTIVLIAHRISTLRNCDKIIELSAKGVARIVSYQDLINQQIVPIGA
ncbi:MAG: ABC transporter ATP-binding protein [Proteobacteria bacterium]|nr:ABC transporter ATP-binding protein [Pseudomonadota bacterium]